MAGVGSPEGAFEQLKKVFPQGMDELLVMWSLFKDGRVSPWVKAVVPTLTATAVLGCLKYGDVVSDKVPFIGKLDKPALAAGCLLLGALAFKSLSPVDAIVEATRKVGEERKKREDALRGVSSDTPEGTVSNEKKPKSSVFEVI